MFEMQKSSIIGGFGFEAHIKRNGQGRQGKGVSLDHDP